MNDEDRLPESIIIEAVKAFDKRQRGEYVVECRNLFLTTQNPLWVWDAWQLCRKYDFPIPEWIYEHFDEIGEALLCLANGEKPLYSKEIPRQTADAIGITGRIGSRSRFEEYKAQKRRVEIVYALWKVEDDLKNKRLSPKQGEDKFLIVAEQFHYEEPKTIRRIYKSETAAMKKRAEYIRAQRLPDGGKPSKIILSLRK